MQKLILETQGILKKMSTIVNRRRRRFNANSKKWQESDKGHSFKEITDYIEDDIESLEEDLKILDQDWTLLA